MNLKLTVFILISLMMNTTYCEANSHPKMRSGDMLYLIQQGYDAQGPLEHSDIQTIAENYLDQEVALQLEYPLPFVNSLLKAGIPGILGDPEKFYSNEALNALDLMRNIAAAYGILSDKMITDIEYTQSDIEQGMLENILLQEGDVEYPFEISENCGIGYLVIDSCEVKMCEAEGCPDKNNPTHAGTVYIEEFFRFLIGYIKTGKSKAKSNISGPAAVCCGEALPST